ncbi:MAG: hypothetical protein AAGA18_11260 [Verrucomicrobiota bacterium]
MKIDLRTIKDDGSMISGSVPTAHYDLPLKDFIKWETISYQLEIQILEDECLIRGKIQTEFEVSCARCVDPIPWKVDVGEFCQSYRCHRDSSIDLTSDIREDILLSLPMVYACKLDAQQCCPLSGKSYLQQKDEFSDLRKKDVWGKLDNLKTD